VTIQTVQQPFGGESFPRRIEDDRMFSGWAKSLPRLWYLEQRQATRLDAESLFGSATYAVFYGRSGFTTLDAPVQTVEFGPSLFERTLYTDIGVPAQTVERQVSYTRTSVTELTITQEIVVARPTGGPVNPIVHPVTGAEIE
jgi:hypothetical protein